MSQGNVISAATWGLVNEKDDVSIGAILIDAGRLSPKSAEEILRLQQQEHGLRFGAAGLRLGALTQADIDFALARQFDYPYLVRGLSEVSESVVAAYEPLNPLVERLRTLRTQLMLRWFRDDPVRKSLAVLSAARREGRSFIAANLAVLFSQVGKRTLLIDADLRNPCQHELFGLENRTGLSALLSGRGGSETIRQILGLSHLSVLPAGVTPPNPHELLVRPVFQRLLNQLAEQLDVILIDSPATSEYADAQVIAVHAGGAMIVVRKNMSRAWRVQGVSEYVSDAKATVVGTVLNSY
jgi:protein-tyrosine kinase